MRMEPSCPIPHGRGYRHLGHPSRLSLNRVLSCKLQQTSAGWQGYSRLQTITLIDIVTHHTIDVWVSGDIAPRILNLGS